jgi:hypothetical protein
MNIYDHPPDSDPEKTGALILKIRIKKLESVLAKIANHPDSDPEEAILAMKNAALEALEEKNDE